MDRRVAALDAVEASKTAAWTMATTRVVTRGEVFAARTVWAMIRFQSVTTSARAAPLIAVMTMTTAIALRKRFMGGSPCSVLGVLSGSRTSC
jgi:hypothetical protein